MLGVAQQAVRDFLDDECPVRAAALSYYTVFALPPLLVLLLLVAGVVWDANEAQRALEGQFATLIGSEGARAIHTMISSAQRPGSGGALAAVLGGAGLLFGATGAFLQLQGALNRAWEVKPDPEHGGLRNFLLKRVLSFGMILGVAFLLIVSLALSALISAFGDRLGGAIPEAVLQVGNALLSFAIMTALFAAIFKILPDADVRWRDVWLGALATSVLFVLGKFLIGLYLGRSEPGSAFGAASALALVLVWIYYAGMIVLLGAEFTQAWAERRGAAIRPESGAIRLDDEPRDEPRGDDNQHAGRQAAMDRLRSGNGRSAQLYRGDGLGDGSADEQSIGELFKQVASDSSHLMQQEIALAKMELAVTTERLGQAGAKLGIAAGLALPGLLALTAFAIIALGNLVNSYWLSSLLVGLALLAVGAMLARRAIATLKGGLGVPQTAATVRDDVQWAKEEARTLKRQMTA